MIIVGINGGMSLVDEDLDTGMPAFTHDGAVAIVDDGEVLFASEEERLNRIKHSNKAPLSALVAGLTQTGITPEEVDVFAYYTSEPACEQMLTLLALENSRLPRFPSSRALMQGLLETALHTRIASDRLAFVPHHVAHATAAFLHSGFERSLVVTLDGDGEGTAGLVLDGQGRSLSTLREFSTARASIGFFYWRVIKFLGYSIFDEYKVMGLAPYGDPERYRELFRSFYELLPEGKLVIHFDKLLALSQILEPRRKGEAFTQTHKDVARALQDATEALIFHVLRHFRDVTGHVNLCMAGGVAHNCTANGKLLASGLFERIFVHPASHDAGCALGAALHLWSAATVGTEKPRKIQHVSWGRDLGDDEAVGRELRRWRRFLDSELSTEAIERTARLLADGEVVGWVQGRSEFGPRALGNRSILADPRPEENKQRINSMIKKREGYRPFAPAVLAEHATALFEIPGKDSELPFMSFAVKVREEQRARLGAVTHVDGTARVQTVARQANQRFWGLIEAFGRITGVPCVLNTSFNNNVEPIVDSATDAIVCFLTTGLDTLVLGNHLVRRRRVDWEDYLSLVPRCPPYVSVHEVVRFPVSAPKECRWALHVSFDRAFEHSISANAFQVLRRADGIAPLAKLVTGLDRSAREGVVQEMLELWAARLVNLVPSADGSEI